MTSPEPSEPRTGQQLYHGGPLTPAGAIRLVVVAIGTLYAVQILAVSVGVPALAASVVSNLAVIAVVWMSVRHHKLTFAHLGLRRVPARFVVSAVLLGISMWVVTALLVDLINPPGDVDKLQKLVEQLPLVPTLIAFTIFPALAEELVFRGVLALSLASRFRQAIAILISAATFALYHLFPPQIVTTFVLGLVLGLLTVRSRSIVPSIIVHVLNNTAAIVLARNEVPAFGAFVASQPLPTLGIAVVLVASGIVLAVKGAR